MGESASARTQRELADLRGQIERDADALKERVREDIDPRNLVRRQPFAVFGGLGSLVSAAALLIVRKARTSRTAEQRVDVLVEGFGGRIDKLKGKARKRFRDQLKKEMAEVEATGPKDVAIGVASAALTTLATTMAQGFGRRLLGDETASEDDRRS
ncbi:MAG: hypothetical protein KGN00_13470 [Chloroflexota bacterium]|nr:hypothetical protein [Chloroflexota bacterium]